MKLFWILCVVMLLSSCTSDRNDPITRVGIETIFTDSLSIRAITPIDTNSVWFAANNGRIGLIDGKVPKLAAIRFEDSLLSFRAIAKTTNNVFVLSIANPGVLYKIGVDGKGASDIVKVYEEKGEKVFYDAIAFWNDQEGIAMGDPTDACLSILITRDGGNNWEKLACSVLPAAAEGEAAFAASNSNISIVGDHVWIATGGKKARVFYSANKGVNWQVFETPMLQGGTMTGIYSIDFFDEKNGIIVGGDWEKKDFNEGNKAITKDGGKTWSLISNGKGPGFRSSVSFVPNTKGREIVSLGSPGISYSADNGESWEELSKEGFYALEFVNDSIAFASGSKRIAKLKFYRD